MEIGSDGLMNSMFMTRIYDNIWTGEEEISLQSLMAFTSSTYQLKFIYSEKATKFCKISTLDLTITT